MANSIAVKFQEAIFTDIKPYQRLTDAVRRCGAFSGIHDFDIEKKIDEDFSDISDWTLDTTDGTTWTVHSGGSSYFRRYWPTGYWPVGYPYWPIIGPMLVIAGGGNPVWYEAIHDTEVPPSFVASFTVAAGQGAFVFRGKTGASDCYIAFWTGATCGFARVDNAKAETLLTSMPFGFSLPARVEVEVSWRYDSADENRKWLQMTLYVDGMEYVSYADDIGGTAYDWDGDGIGFAVTGANTLSVEALVVSEFSRLVDYVSIDPGESVAQGLGRAVSTTRVLYEARFDGTMRVTRPGDRDTDYVIIDEEVMRFMKRHEYRDVMTHIRTIGAIHSVDRFDDDEGEVHMHRFRQSDNPNLMAEPEVYDEAGYQLNDAKEQQGSYQMVLPLKPFIERHDRIVYDMTPYRVLGVNHLIQQTEHGPALTTVLELREYFPI